MQVNVDLPSTWKKYQIGMCNNCMAHCCTLPVEASIQDLIRLEFILATDHATSPRKIFRQLHQKGLVTSFRARSGFFLLAQKTSGECIFLGPDRRCQQYEKRPDVCRKFPAIGPRPGHCPKIPQKLI